MKAALIAPIPHLHDFGRGPFHLLLTHLLTETKYREHYRNERSCGSYLVLDNSAHERGAGEDPTTLLKAGFYLDAQEIVVPDVLFDAEGTIEACLTAHETWFENGSEILDSYAPAFMYVPQGKDKNDWSVCFDSLVKIHGYCSRKYSLRRDLVIGVSKDYDSWDGGLMRLIDEDIVPMREQLAQSGIKMHVHLLGWMRNLWNLQVIARTHPWIRSTDSAKPFVYALSNTNLLNWVTKEPPAYPKRKDNYFQARMTSPQKKFAENNAWAFTQAAEGMLW